jgi:hypothetical protein
VTISRLRKLIAPLALALLVAGCRSANNSAQPVAVDLEAIVRHSFELKQPEIMLIAESGGSRADDKALAAFQSRAVQARTNSAVMVVLDVSLSRNRATAAPFHILQTPLLVCRSSMGVTVSRDAGAITRELILRRIDEAAAQGPGLDAKARSLEQAVVSTTNSAAAEFHLAQFFLAQQDQWAATDPLWDIAHSDASPVPLRIRAWVLLARAQLWAAEPEKGRHEAEALIATLGDKTPEARAGGNLVLGLQDANAKRTDLARQELQAAVSAAPDSPYGKEAAATLANLPKGGN